MKTNYLPFSTLSDKVSGGKQYPMQSERLLWSSVVWMQPLSFQLVIVESDASNCTQISKKGGFCGGFDLGLNKNQYFYSFSCSDEESEWKRPISSL